MRGGQADGLDDEDDDDPPAMLRPPPRRPHRRIVTISGQPGTPGTRDALLDLVGLALGARIAHDTEDDDLALDRLEQTARRAAELADLFRARGSTPCPLAPSGTAHDRRP